MNRPPTNAGAALRFDIRRITLPNSYTPTQRERFTTALNAALTQLASQHSADQFASMKRISHLEAERLSEGATPEEAAVKIATQIMASLQKAKPAPRGATGVTAHV